MAAIKHENQIRLAAGLAALPSLLVAMILLWQGDFSPTTKWSLAGLIVLLALWAITAVHQRVAYPLRTVSNMLAALRERDFSMRARGARGDDALGEVLIEINSLANLLREQRLAAIETSALLRRIMAEIDVALLAFDDRQHLRLINGHGERLLGRPAEQVLGMPAAALGVQDLLKGSTPRLVDMTFAGRSGRWELRRGTFLESGVSRQLIVLSDLTRTLREEERQAWQRLVHVLRHEVNNSLAPICSVAESLTGMLDAPAESIPTSDLREGLTIISDRARGLSRFMTAYAQLTRLPKPQLRPFVIGDCIRRAAGLETRVAVSVLPGPELTVRADQVQIEQLLVNLIRNGAEAAMESGNRVEIGWKLGDDDPAFCEIWVEDDGPGISNPDNLFVPFYTTKPNGTGIGLPLCRQIAEGHGGTVTLANRPGRPGCRATCRIPVS